MIMCFVFDESKFRKILNILKTIPNLDFGTPKIECKFQLLRNGLEFSMTYLKSVMSA